jgi:hypothetical protein
MHNVLVLLRWYVHPGQAVRLEGQRIIRHSQEHYGYCTPEQQKTLDPVLTGDNGLDSVPTAAVLPPNGTQSER